MTLRYFKGPTGGVVHSVQVDDHGRPGGHSGALCGQSVVVVEEKDGTVTLLHEVMPWTLTNRCRKCAYAELAKGPVKAWERPRE